MTRTGLTMMATAALCVCVGSLARAEDKPAESPKPKAAAGEDPRKGVKARSTVQVVEGNAPVDDVISRLRRDRTAKPETRGTGPGSPTAGPTSSTAPGSPSATPGSTVSKEARELRRERLRLDDNGDARDRRLGDGDRREERKELRERLKQRRRDAADDRRDGSGPRR